MELIELISVLLEPADLRSLRLVCREFNRKTLSHFGLANFTILQTDLSRKSLQRLQDISETKYLAVHVHCLRIKHTDDGKLGQGFRWRHYPTSVLADQLDSAHLLRDVLATKLLKCRSVHIDSYDEYQPPLEQDFLIPSDAVGMVLSMVAEADLSLRSFTVESNHHGNGRLDTQRLQMSLSHTLRFLTAWSHIEELVLDYAITPDQYDWISHLISSSPRLRKLSLGFHDDSSSLIERLSSSQSLNRLEDLSLRSAHLSVETMSALLLHNRESLHSLSLRHATLENEGKWATVLEGMQGHFPRLENLALFWLKETDIRRVTFSGLSNHPVVPGSEEHGPGNRVKCDSHRLEGVKEPFRLRYWGGARRAVGIEYRGSGVNHVLSALAGTAETI
ncbi:MAG: hypothetical protein LQ343_005554 [Gyalolechia ehrenbergii]|nr:MAG: hypothetical protein LQ343_005554 [Gyalolechia ehrenbergii]